MAKNFNFVGRLKWFRGLQTTAGAHKATVMLIPPNAGNFSKKTTFVDFFGDVAEQILHVCTKDCYLSIQGEYKIRGNKAIFIGLDFQKLKWDTELNHYVPTV